MKRIHLPAAALLGVLLVLSAACAPALAEAVPEGTPVWKFCHGCRDGLETAVIRGWMTDCEEGPIPVEISAEEAESIRRLAIGGVVTRKANDLCVTAGTWLYTFSTPEGQYLLSVELYEGLLVSNDGMYTFSR